MKSAESRRPDRLCGSLPMRGEWIEIARPAQSGTRPAGLSPCGESGLKYPCTKNRDIIHPGLSPCGESGLKLAGEGYNARQYRLSPCGESGLKSCDGRAAGGRGRSLPMRGEWIEISEPPQIFKGVPSLPMRGEWIEMPAWRPCWPVLGCLSPCGESGLKCFLFRLALATCASSLPMRGEWIEMTAPPTRGAYIWSLPMRGEWIEISLPSRPVYSPPVSPHAGRVD